MKQSKTTGLIPLLFLLIPWLYLAFIWGDLPDRIPTHFGITGAPDAERPALAVAVDKAHKLAGIGKLFAAWIGWLVHPRRRIARRRGSIASQRQHVVDPGKRQFIEHVSQRHLVVTYAGQVRHRLDANLVLDLRRQLGRRSLRRTAGPICHRHKRRLQFFEIAQSIEQSGKTRRRPGRKKLKRKARRGLLKSLGDAHGLRVLLRRGRKFGRRGAQKT